MSDTGTGSRAAALAARINALYRANHGEAVQREVVEVPVTVYSCARCGHEWRLPAEAPIPRACPSCRARKWTEPPPVRISDTARKCGICGHEWKARKAARPGSCPNCGSPYWDRPGEITRKPRTSKLPIFA